MRPGIVAAGSLPTIPGVTNFSRANNAAFLTALSAVKAGTNDVKIACMGDSITAGKGATVSVNGWTGARAGAYPRLLRTALASASIPSIQADFWGEGTSLGTTSDIDLYMGNIARSGSGFAISGSVQSIAGLSHAQNGSQVDSTSTITYTCPAGMVADSVAVFTARNTSIGKYVVSLDGGAESPEVDTAGTPGAFTTTFSYASAATGHTVRIRKSSTTAIGVFVLGVYFYNSSEKGLQLWNWGRGGWRTDDWVNSTSAWFPGFHYHTQGAKLTIVELWGNDAISRPSSTTTTITNLTTIIDNLQAAGSTVWIVNPQPFDPAGSIGSTASSLYRSAVASLADSKNCTLIDETHHYPTWSAWNGAGFAWDANHPSQTGYQHKVDSFYTPMLRALWAAAP
ncbi:MAG: hypothetical protein AB202_03255 [Parcubacteria bacterium C7867-007]|nr:MAG: hypothetical protein AB202_03255 [Parcubacteria bacterium C7867-007]